MRPQSGLSLCGQAPSPSVKDGGQKEAGIAIAKALAVDAALLKRCDYMMLAESGERAWDDFGQLQLAEVLA